MSEPDDIDYWTGAIHHGDALATLPQLPTDSVDLVATDPPYNVSEGADDRLMPDRKDIQQDFGEWDKGHVYPEDWIPDCARVLHEEGVLVTFYANKRMEEVRRALDDAGLDFYEKVYWVKENPVPQIRLDTFRFGVEEAWMAARGGGRTHYINDELDQRSNAIHAPLASGAEYSEHPTQKPLKVMREFIRYYCPPDGVVLDPFVGSGTTAVAAELEGRRWIGIEQDEEWAEEARRRVREEAYLGQDALEVSF